MEQEITLRQLILHFLPGADLASKAAALASIAAIRIMVDENMVPDTPYHRAFNEFFATWQVNSAYA